ncbi:MAG: YitT family protein [Deltaproteobacteria bacterium]|nr:MAG: YitT family protein [Deltaproteobacteria bacterium]
MMNGQRMFAGVKDDFYDLVHSIGSRRFWQTIAVTFIGLVLFSIGLNGILVPHKLIASGAMGMALLIFYVVGAPSVGVWYWLLNIPILLLGWRAMSLKYVVMALIGVFFSGLTLVMTKGIIIPCDPLMASIIAGVLTGSGVGLYLRYGGSAGGIDIVAAVLRRKYGIPMGTTFIVVNVVNFAAGGIINHSLDTAFYTAMAMYVHSHVVDRWQSGLSPRKSALIITGKPEEITEQILKRLGRGVTYLHGSGAMSKRELRVIYTVVNMVELARLKEIIFYIDSNAFLAINDTSEVIGHRFVSWADAGFEARRARKLAQAQDLLKQTADETADSGNPPPPSA